MIDRLRRNRQQLAAGSACAGRDALCGRIGLSRLDTVNFVNPAAETLLQRSAPLLRGRPLTDMLPPKTAPLLDFHQTGSRREGGVMSARSIRVASPHIVPTDHGCVSISGWRGWRTGADASCRSVA